MKTRERIVGNRIFLEIVADESDEDVEFEEAAPEVRVVDLVPDCYGER